MVDILPSRASRYSEVNSTWLITSELANQRAPKALFTCVNLAYYSEIPVVLFRHHKVSL